MFITLDLDDCQHRFMLPIWLPWFFFIALPLMHLNLPSYFLCFFVFVGSPFSILLINTISTSNWRIQTLMHSILCFICAYQNKFKYKFQLNSRLLTFCVMLIVAIFKIVVYCAKEIHGEELCATFVHYGTSMHYCSWIFHETWCFMELQCFSKYLWSGILCFGFIMKMVDFINGGAILLGTWTLILNIVFSWLWSSIEKVGKGFYLWRNVVCLFCLYWWDPPKWDALNHLLGFFGKLLRKRGASARFHGVWTCNAKVLEYWMIYSLKIKLNCS